MGADMEQESLPVDFADDADLRAKLPRAKAILVRKEERLRSAQTDVESWRDLVRLMEQRGGVALDGPVDSAATAIGSMSPDQGQLVDHVVNIVENFGKPVRARDVSEALRTAGFDVTNDTVSNSLYYAAIRATPRRISKLVARGMYAPLAWQPSPVESNGAGEIPFVPASAFADTILSKSTLAITESSEGQ